MRSLSLAERSVGRLVGAALIASGLVLPAVALARRRVDPPVAVLFVSRGCPHCVGAAARFDSSARGPAILVVDSLGWPRPPRHAVLVRDNDHALARAFSIRAVPALVTIHAVVRYDVDPRH